MFACLYSPSTATDVLEHVARQFSPRIERTAASLVILDVRGLDRLLGDAHDIGAELVRALAGVHPGALAAPHVAVAGTRVSAQVLAHTLPHLTIVAPEAESAALAPLPVDALASIGAPPDLLATLARWGIRTLGAFAALPRAPLASRLGQDGLAWQRAARGEDARPLVPAPIEERFEDTIDLEWPVAGIEPLAFVLGRLLDPLSVRLEVRGRAAAAIELRVRLTVGRAWRMHRIELPSPMRDPRVLRALLCLKLESASESDTDSVDRVGLFIEPTPARIAQGSLLAEPDITLLAPDVVATLMARLRALMGHDRCGRARLLDTHRPDSFAMTDFLTTSVDAQGHPVDALVEGRRVPVTAPRALRRLRHPIPARVTVAHGRPVRIATDRRGWLGGHIVWCAGPWRISGDWWRPSGDPYSRQEWDLSTTDGATYRVYEDRQLARWFIDAILD